MMEIKLYTWIIAIFGAITFLPLLIAQLIMILNPNSQATKGLIIGKGQDWRDKSHFKYSIAFAWADWIIIFPLLVIGNTGVFMGQLWGYIAWVALGVLSIYFSIIFWVMEREHSLPSCGKLAYYTYFWGFFLYWGIAAVVYSILQII